MTPANIRAIRMRCGLSVKECAKVLGMTEAQVETMERAKFNTVFLEHFDTLARIEEEMDILIDKLVLAPQPVLVGYMSTEDMLAFEPGLHALRSNVVHRMALAQAQAAFRDFTPRVDVPIVELIPGRFLAWANDECRPVDSTARRDWALMRTLEFKIVPAGG